MSIPFAKMHGLGNDFLITLDEERNLVFVPTGNTNPDYFGGHRDPRAHAKRGLSGGLDHYSSSVVALDGETGEVVWYYHADHNAGAAVRLENGNIEGISPKLAVLMIGTNNCGSNTPEEFLEGDPDRPIITGRVYHGANMPPYGLPAEKTKSTIKSDSSLGGGGSNEMIGIHGDFAT